MSFTEKSAWAVIATVTAVFAGYVVIVVSQSITGGVAQTALTGLLVGCAITMIVALAAVHIALAAAAPTRAEPRPSSRRRPDAIILASGAVFAAGLTVTGAASVWIVTVLFAALAGGEIAHAATRIAHERKATAHV